MTLTKLVKWHEIGTAVARGDVDIVDISRRGKPLISPLSQALTGSKMVDWLQEDPQFGPWKSSVQAEENRRQM